MKNKVIGILLSAMLVGMTACGYATVEQAVKEPVSEVQTAAVENSDEAESDETESNETESNEAESEETVSEESERFQPEWTKDAVVYEVNIRQYTKEGSFNAFAEHLQELKDMGVNVLWFMPTYPISSTKRSGELGSYYSITDYCGVNPEFGTEEDFAALIDKAHEMGFHVMLDWVANHTGWDSEWITEHPDWYTQDAEGRIISPENMGWPDVADLNYDNQEMRAEMIECMEYWVEEYDVDGFRCDFATGVPRDFWEQAREALEEIKPVYMLAEDNLVKELLEEAFDMNYNWNLYDATVQVAKDSKQANVLKLYIPKDFPDGTYTLNFLDNHDKNSYERTIMGAYGPDALPAMFSFIYTIPGAPLVYSGDEIGLDHAIGFTYRDPIDWESSTYDYRPLLADLAEIRSKNPALYCGNYGGDINYYDLGNKNVFAFYREKDGNHVECIYNLSKREQTVDVSEIIQGTETVLLHGQGSEVIETEDVSVKENGPEGEVVIGPWEFWVLSE